MGHGYPVKLGHVDKIPGYGVATVPAPKIGDYLLNPNHPANQGKWAIFANIGYSQERPEELIEDLKNGLKENGGDKQLKNGKGEITYIVEMDLGRTKKRKVKTIWQVDKDGDPPHFVTAY